MGAEARKEPRTAAEWVFIICTNYRLHVPDDADGCMFCTEFEGALIAFARQQVEVLEAKIRRLRGWVNDLQAGLYVNCVYCGHRYGPDTETPVSKAQVLKEHIKVCPDHPMSTLTRDLAAHRAMIAKMADELDGIQLDPCAHMTTVKAIKDLLAHPLVQQAREEKI